MSINEQLTAIAENLNTIAENEQRVYNAGVAEYKAKFSQMIDRSISGNIVIPNDITKIGNYAFCFCSNITGVTLHNGITIIGSFGFYYCQSINNIIIPNSVSEIETYAFRYCTGLQYVDFSTFTTIPIIAANAFESTTCEFRVPSVLYDEWIAATNWAAYAERIVAV